MHSAIWSADGQEILYNPAPQTFEAVSFRTTPTVEFGAPVSVPRPFQTGPPTIRRQYDMTPSGRILALMQPGQAAGPSASPKIHVVLNWFEELKQRVPVR